MCKITVLLPIYNSEKFLEEAILSILTQTYVDFEIICVYDKRNSEASNSILRRLASKDDRIKLINSYDQVGLVNQLNVGIKSAKGKYIARMDADDIAEQDRLEKQFNYLENNTYIDVVGSWGKAFGEVEYLIKEKFEKRFNYIISDESIKKQICLGTPCIHPSIMIRADVIKKYYYVHDYPAMEDYFLFMNLYKDGHKIRVIQDKLINYRIHRESKSRQDSIKELLAQKNHAKTKMLMPNECKEIWIWGTTLGMEVLVEQIQKKLLIKQLKIKGIISDDFGFLSYKGIKVYKKDEINITKDMYICITTPFNYEEISQYLESNGLEIQENYLFML